MSATKEPRQPKIFTAQQIVEAGHKATRDFTAENHSVVAVASFHLGVIRVLRNLGLDTPEDFFESEEE